MERVQQHTVEQIIHVPIPQIQVQSVESVQVIPRELFPERIEEQIVDIPVHPIVAEIAGSGANYSSGALSAKHSGADCRSSSATGCGGHFQALCRAEC